MEEDPERRSSFMHSRTDLASYYHCSSRKHAIPLQLSCFILFERTVRICSYGDVLMGEKPPGKVFDRTPKDLRHHVSSFVIRCTILFPLMFKFRCLLVDFCFSAKLLTKLKSPLHTSYRFPNLRVTYNIYYDQH